MDSTTQAAWRALDTADRESIARVVADLRRSHVPRKIEKPATVFYATHRTWWRRDEQSLEPLKHPTFLAYEERHHEAQEVLNETFIAALRLVGQENGRSTYRLWWEDLSGIRYPMFGQDFMAHVPRLHARGWLIGEFKFRKAGQNYGVVLLDD